MRGAMFVLPCVRCMLLCLIASNTAALLADDTLLYNESFARTEYGRSPNGWRVLHDVRPSRNWAVDGSGSLRFTLKERTGIIVYDGYTLQPKPARSLTDVTVIASFTKTEDENVSFGIVGRVQDHDNYYLARFSGTQRLELVKVKDGVEVPLDSVPLDDLTTRRPTGRLTLQRYRLGEHWTLMLRMKKNRIEAIVHGQDGLEQARISSRNDDFKTGWQGLCCTRFAAAQNFQLRTLDQVEVTADDARLVKRNAAISANEPEYSIAKAVWDATALNLAPDQIQQDYDVVIAGAGTGGWAAALQAARLGAKVLLLEESDWIGGQMAAAGVTTMDEDSVWMKFPVRERGIYREFHESMQLHYLTLEKDPLVAYYGWPEQLEGGYEPKVARAIMYGFIDETRKLGNTLHVALRTRVTSVKKSDKSVQGVELNCSDGRTKSIACRVLIDATEYGDVIPLTGARYRVGNCMSDSIDPKALVQDHTWTCVVREYPTGIPPHLKIQSPPPGYETGSGKRYRKYTNDGVIIWGGAGKGYKGERHWSVYFAWRGMVDSESPLIGESSRLRHTQAGFNGGNDYPVTAATIEDPKQRLLDEREGIYKTLGALYYFQQMGVPWSLAEDEGFDTPANRTKMKQLNLRADLEQIAVHLPQHPYVRECRRIVGVQTLTAHDMGRFEEAKHVTSSVAMGDYFMDLDHGKTAHAIETDLDSGELPKPGGGPFQVPLEVFIPETIDGFIPAEKNISQSRLANGATRLQPITMLTGQAAGTLAALAAKSGTAPRHVAPVHVQQALLRSGCTLIQRWYADVPWGTELWRATQILALYKIIDRPGDIDRDNRILLASKSYWHPEARIEPEERERCLVKVLELTGKPYIIDDSIQTTGQLAVALASHLYENPPK